MTIMEMMGQSGTLTLLGMTMVFGFLITMIIVISLVGRIIGSNKSGDSKILIAKTSVRESSDNKQITAAITAAVNEYKK